MEPPVPISNTEVKLPSADDTALATGWENRSLPEALDTTLSAGHGSSLNKGPPKSFDNPSAHPVYPQGTGAFVRISQRIQGS